MRRKVGNISIIFDNFTYMVNVGGVSATKILILPSQCNRYVSKKVSFTVIHHGLKLLSR